VGRVLRATRAYLSRFDRGACALKPRFTLHHDAYGGGYGTPTLAAVESIDLHERLVGVRGEVTYSGKALAALRTLSHDSRYKHSTILFWNTLSSVPLPPTTAMNAKVPAPFQRFFFGELPL
jgi:D-cysteine desulfhydrase